MCECVCVCVKCACLGAHHHLLAVALGHGRVGATMLRLYGCTAVVVFLRMIDASDGPEGFRFYTIGQHLYLLLILPWYSIARTWYVASTYLVRG